MKPKIVIHNHYGNRTRDAYESHGKQLSRMLQSFTKEHQEFKRLPEGPEKEKQRASLKGWVRKLQELEPRFKADI